MIGYWNYTVYATYASAVSALVGFVFCQQGRPLPAVLCLLLSAGLDMIDGRIARTKKDRTRDEKRYGVQLDSLADLLAFGVLPGQIFAAEAAQQGLPAWLLWVLPAVFGLCCLVRLAFFNVRTAADEEASDGGHLDFKGLPAPSIALPLAACYCVRPLMTPEAFAWLLAAVLAVVAAAFVTPFTLKKPGWKLLTPLTVLGIAVVAALLMIYVF